MHLPHSGKKSSLLVLELRSPMVHTTLARDARPIVWRTPLQSNWVMEGKPWRAWPPFVAAVAISLITSDVQGLKLDLCFEQMVGGGEIRAVQVPGRVCWDPLNDESNMNETVWLSGGGLDAAQLAYDGGIDFNNYTSQVRMFLTSRVRSVAIQRVIYKFCNARFPEYFPAYSRLAGIILALYFPHYYISPPRGTYCESPLLDSPMVRGGAPSSHSVDSCSADTSRFTSFNYLGSVKKAGKHPRNRALNYKLTTHNVYYIDPLWTWQHSGPFISRGRSPRAIKSLLQSSPTRVLIVLRHASLIYRCIFEVGFLSFYIGYGFSHCSLHRVKTLLSVSVPSHTSISRNMGRDWPVHQSQG